MDQSVTIPVNEAGMVEVMHNEVLKAYPAIYQEDEVIGFEIGSITNDALVQSLSFTVQTQLNRTNGVVEVKLSGRALDEDLNVPVLEVVKPVEVMVTPIRLKEGLKDQQGGTIVIKENGAKGFKTGESIVIALEAGDVSLSAVPAVSVTQGDIQLGEAKLTETGLEIPVLAGSTEASTIVIDSFAFRVGGLAPLGYYDVTVGNFYKGVLVKLGNVDYDVKATAVFTVGKNIYSINNTSYTMDVKPYSRNGVMMLPVKYVAAALGLEEDQVAWDNENKIITIYGEKTIQLTLWSRQMFINGVPQAISEPATMDEGRSYIPIIEVAKALGIETAWDDTLSSATFKVY